MNIWAIQADEHACTPMRRDAEQGFLFSFFSFNTAKGAGGAMI
jgi:hypothetical protein